MTSERLYHMGAAGGAATWLVLPLMSIIVFSIVYGTDSYLFRYFVVAQAGNTLVMNTVFWVGEILDRERAKGTLEPLFLAPCSRYAWLSGFILAGVLETVIVSTAVLVISYLAFGVRFDPNIPVLVVAVLLFAVALWGMGLIFSGIGLLIKKSNPLANLVYSGLMLLGGLYFPVSELPDLLRYPARALPVGYGLQAISDAALYDAGFGDIWADLLPLAGFAAGLPVAGALMFTWMERKVRVRGELDLY
ncbi:MAG TPA: ABC transporter permease [Thermomicrobiales bacterium]|nr:ABC transporter permease [Thermomicrobiales bacterium]